MAIDDDRGPRAGSGSGEREREDAARARGGAHALAVHRRRRGDGPGQGDDAPDPRHARRTRGSSPSRRTAPTCPGRRSCRWPAGPWQRIDISAIAQPFVDDARREACTARCTSASVNGDEIVYLIRGRLRQAVPDALARRPRRSRCTPRASARSSSRRLHRRRSSSASSRGPGCPPGPSTRSRRSSGLRAEIDDVRRLGYALDREENVPGRRLRRGADPGPHRDDPYGAEHLDAHPRAHRSSRSRRWPPLAIDDGRTDLRGPRLQPALTPGDSATAPTRESTDPMTHAITPAAYHREPASASRGGSPSSPAPARASAWRSRESLASAGADIVGVSYDMPARRERGPHAPSRPLGRTFTPLRADFSDRAAGHRARRRPRRPPRRHPRQQRRHHPPHPRGRALRRGLRPRHRRQPALDVRPVPRGRPHDDRARPRQDRQHRVDAQLPGRHQRARVHVVEVGRRRPDEGAGQRVGRAGRQRQRRRPRVRRDRQHPRPAPGRRAQRRDPRPHPGRPLGRRRPTSPARSCSCARTRADYVNGAILPVDGGWLAR